MAVGGDRRSGSAPSVAGSRLRLVVARAPSPGPASPAVVAEHLASQADADIAVSPDIGPPVGVVLVPAAAFLLIALGQREPRRFVAQESLAGDFPDGTATRVRIRNDLDAGMPFLGLIRVRSLCCSFLRRCTSAS